MKIAEPSGATKAIKIPLDQVGYILVISKAESILKTLKERVETALRKNLEKVTEVDLARCPAFLKCKKYFDTKAWMEGSFAKQLRSDTVEYREEKYATHLL